MRALNNPKVVSLLQDEFINCWLLAKDLDKISNQSKDPDIKKLCGLVKENYKYPVDTVLITSGLSVFDHINVHQTEVFMPNGYFSFLQKGLEKIGIRIESDQTDSGQDKENETDTPQNSGVNATAPKPPVGVKLTRGKPTGTLLEIIRNGGKAPGMAMYPIDVSDFVNGGTIELNLRLGTGEASAQCELCAPDTQNSQFFLTLKSIPDLAPGNTKKLTYQFKKGKMLYLVVKATHGKKDQILASPMLATIQVKAGD